MDVATDPEFDPYPYKNRLTSLELCKTGELLVISVAGDQLCISGNPNALCLFAKNLPCDTDQTSSVSYHVHFDRIGRENHVSEASLRMVLTLKT